MAIEASGDLLVSAAAGAGKTAVLTERIARLISEGADVNELLVVTFTNAAAMEMRSRIEARLTELSESAEGERAVNLRHAAASCERANISTLHSFCMNVLRRNYHEAGVDPAFEVADNIEREILLTKALNETLENRFLLNESTPDEGFKALIAAVRNDLRLDSLIRALYAFCIARPDPDAWLSMALDNYTVNFKEVSSDIASSLVSSAHSELQHFLDRAKELSVSVDEVHAGVRDALRDDMSMLLALILQNDYDSISTGLSAASFSRLTWKRGTDEDEKEDVRLYREELKKSVTRLKKVFSHSLSEEARTAELLSAPIKALIELTRDFMERFRIIKEEAGVIDFSDMEQLTLTALKNPGIADEYRSRFKYIFIDEYQDINPAQEAILASISKGNRFMVGDVKQSIYRFRQAEPNIFIDKYNTYNGENGRIRIDLNRNFRSRTAVLDAANLLFEKLMKGGSVGEIDYSDNAALISGTPDNPAGSVELVLIDPETETYFDYDPAEQEETESSTNAKLQAAYAAKRILEIMETCSKYTADGEALKYRFSDFCILLRSAKNSVTDWVNTLSDCGVPCVTALGEGFYQAIEVRLFVDLLRVIDNRRQDIPLLAVMRSPVFGFTDEELAHVKSDYEGNDILDRAISASRDEQRPSWSIKCSEMLTKIDEWRDKKRLMELAVLVSSVLDESKLKAYVSALHGGGAREDNLETVVSLAAKFSSNGGSLSGFIRFMDAAKESGTEPAKAPPAADAVKLMTVHASKGLEFGVVILGDITKKFRRTYDRDVGVFDSKLGIGLCSVSGGRDEKSMLQRAIASREADRLNAEEMRLLYVAMTRAKDRLILLGVKKNAREYAEKLAHPLSDIRIMRADYYIDWMLGAYFPKGLSNPVRFKNGGELSLNIVGREQSGSSSRGMSADRFSEWLQNAAFVDADGLNERFTLRYAEEADTLLPSKLSVTGLTLLPVKVANAPRFMLADSSVSGADIGTLTHRLLQLIPIKAHTEESVGEELRLLTERGIFTKDEAKLISVGSVVRFFSSDIGKRLIASERAERERSFNLLIGANRLIDTPSDTPIVLQGIIDCCFIENGSWVLVDHKTTHVDGSRNTARIVAERYRKQLELYSAALERLTGIKVAEMYVYLLSSNEAVKL